MNEWQLTRDPDAEALVAQMTALDMPALAARGVLEARRYLEERSHAAPGGPAVDIVEDVAIPDGTRHISARLYRQTTPASQPVVVYFHGGGWVIGSVDASDAFCRRVVAAAGCTLVSVDYRLAPEHPFPAPVEDAIAAVRWVGANAVEFGGDPNRVVVLGDSAGGNLATVAVRHMVTTGDCRVARQILAYPGTTADRPVATRFGAHWPLTDGDRAWFLDQYVGPTTSRSDPDLAPLHADVTGMPPTTILLAGCDPLLDDGLAYAERLCAAGVSVDLHVFAGQIHGFLTMDESILPRSREALGLVANVIRST